MLEQVWTYYQKMRTMRHFLLELVITWSGLLAILTYGVKVPPPIRGAQQIALVAAVVLAGVLVTWRGFRTRWGAQALAMIDTHSVDLILMDVLMPEMDGITATRHIREHLSGKVAAIPILGLTANANEGTHQKCVQAGMNDIVFKPFNRAELIKKIEMLTQLSTV